MSERITKKWLETLSYKELLDAFEYAMKDAVLKNTKKADKEVRYCREEIIERMKE